MGIVKKQSFLITIFLYIGLIIGYINVTFLYPNILEPAEFGLTRWFISMGGLLAIFAQLGLPNVTIRYFPYFKNAQKEHGGYLGFLAVTPIIGLTILSCLMLFFKEAILSKTVNIDDIAFVTPYYELLLLLITFLAYFNVLNAYSSSLLKAAIPSFFKEVFAKAGNSILLVLYFFNCFDFQTLIFLFILTHGGQIIGLLCYLKFINELHLTFDFQIFKRPIFKEMVKYGMYALFAYSAMLLVQRLDMLMITSFLGLKETGIYAVFLYVGTVVIIPSKAIISIASPLIANAWKKNDLALIKDVYQKSSLNQLIICGLFFIGVWANVDNFGAILGEKYEAGKYVAVLIGLAQLFNVTTGVNGVIIVNSKYYRYDLIFVFLLLTLTIGTNYVFIQTYGLIGAAMATALSIFLYNLIKLIFVWFLFDMHPFTVNTIKALVVGIVVLGINFLLPTLEFFVWDLLFRSSIITALYGSSMLLWKVSPDINGMVNVVYQRIIRFFNR